MKFQNLNKLYQVVHKSSKFLIKQGPWVFFGRVFLLFSSFLISLILTKNMSLEDYGQYKYFISILGIFGIFSSPESAKLIVKYLPRNKTYISSYLLNIRLLLCLFGSLISLLLFIYYFFYLQLFSFHFLAISIFLPFYFSYDIYNFHLLALEKLKLLNITNSLKILFQLILIIISIIFFNDPIFIFIAFLVGFSIPNFYLSKSKIIGIDYLVHIPVKLKSFLKKNVLLILLVSIPSIMLEHIDKILIGDHISLEKLGLYSIGILVGKHFNNFFKPFIASFGAKQVNNKIDLTQSIFIFICASFIGYFVGNYIFPALIVFVYGVSYTSSIVYCKVIVFSLGLYVLHTITYNEVMYNRKSNLNFIYLNNILIPAISIIYLLILFLFYMQLKNILIFISLVYPLKLFTSILFLNFVKYKNI